MLTLRAIDVHLPPNAKGTHEAKVEAVNALAEAMHDVGYALAFGDMNSKPGQTIPGPTLLAHLVEGKTYGDRIDCAVGRGLRRVKVSYEPVVGGVPMRSDHNHAVRITFWLGYRFWTVWFYNLQVGRSDKVAAEEIRAILATRSGLIRKFKPLALMLCEATGYDLPAVDGYEQIRQRPGPRANVAMYVEAGRLARTKWLDQHLTWARTDHPGEHDPRSFIQASILMGTMRRIRRRNRKQHAGG